MLSVRCNRSTVLLFAAEDGRSSLVSASGELIDNSADASERNPAIGLEKWVKIVFCETSRSKVTLKTSPSCLLSAEIDPLLCNFFDRGPNVSAISGYFDVPYIQGSNEDVGFTAKRLSRTLVIHTVCRPCSKLSNTEKMKHRSNRV
jgi:hypothetical protein